MWLFGRKGHLSLSNTFGQRMVRGVHPQMAQMDTDRKGSIRKLLRYLRMSLLFHAAEVAKGALIRRLLDSVTRTLESVRAMQ